MRQTGYRIVGRLREDAIWIFALLTLVATPVLIFWLGGLIADRGCDPALKSDRPIAVYHCD